MTRGKHAGGKRRGGKGSLRFWLWISPWLIGFVLLTLIPVVASLYISFTEWQIIDDPVWVGLDNYRDLLKDPVFRKSLKVTFLYVAMNVPLSMLLCLAAAMLLNGDLPYSGILRTVYYLPCVVSSVASALLWSWIFNYRSGLFNRILAFVGVQGPNWLGDERWALISLVIMSLWGIGGGIVFYLAGLQTVPRHLHEVAKLAGAGWWRRLFTITLPSMSPIIFFALLTNIISGLQSFTSVYLSTSGGPDDSTMFYALYLYLNAFSYHKMGKACAMAWVLFIIILILSLLVMKASRPFVYYENDGGRDM